MPSPYSALTAQALKEAVETATSRDEAGRPINTDWSAAAEALTEAAQVGVTAQQVCDTTCGAWIDTSEDTGYTNWEDAAAALRDRLEQDREPGANTAQGDE